MCVDILLVFVIFPLPMEPWKGYQGIHREHQGVPRGTQILHCHCCTRGQGNMNIYIYIGATPFSEHGIYSEDSYEK